LSLATSPSHSTQQPTWNEPSHRNWTIKAKPPQPTLITMSSQPTSGIATIRKASGGWAWHGETRAFPCLCITQVSASKCGIQCRHKSNVQGSYSGFRYNSAPLVYGLLLAAITP